MFHYHWHSLKSSKYLQFLILVVILYAVPNFDFHQYYCRYLSPASRRTFYIAGISPCLSQRDFLKITQNFSSASGMKSEL